MVEAAQPWPRGPQVRPPGADRALLADFLCRERALIVEVDGATQSTEEELAQDARRSRFLEEKGYTVLRVLNAEVMAELDGVLETILLALEKRQAAGLIPRAPHPDLLPASRERERSGERE